QFVGDVERRHHGDALVPGDLAPVAYLAHPPVEELHRLEQVLALRFLASDAVFSSENRHVERDRMIHRIQLVDSGSCSNSESIRDVAAAILAVRARFCSSARPKSRVSASFSARKRLYSASSAATFCSRPESTESMSDYRRKVSTTSTYAAGLFNAGRERFVAD